MRLYNNMQNISRDKASRKKDYKLIKKRVEIPKNGSNDVNSSNDHL